MTATSTVTGQKKPILVAAVIAAVQAYLDEEAAQEEPQEDGKVSSWRMEVRSDTMGPESGRGSSWTSRD